jgi:MarR family transcriptional regulator, organic hydroperoxide resistance regulator
VKSDRPPESEAWGLLVRLFLAQRANLPALPEDLQLSPAQCHVLHLIDPERPIPMGRLADTLACDRSNVTGLVDRLEARGLIQRQPSTDDRRVKVLVLTPTGLQVRALLVQRMSAAPATLDRLTDRERRMLVRLLQRLLE